MAKMWNCFRSIDFGARSLGGPWTKWIGSTPVQIRGCCPGGALSWWFDELLLVVVVLRWPVVARRTDLVERHFEMRSAELSWRQVGLLTQSLQHRRSRRACVRAYVHAVHVSVYMCMYVCVRTCIYVYRCLCTCIIWRMYVNTCVYVCVCILVHRLWLSVAVLWRVWAVAWMHMCIRAHMYACAYVCLYTYMCIFFAMSVACTLGAQDTSACAAVYVIQMYLCYRRTHLRHTRCRGAHMCICIYMCIRMHMYMDACVRLWYWFTRWGIVAEIFCLWINLHVHAYVYVCSCMRVYVHVHMYVFVYICFCVYVCIYIYIHTRVGVHMHSCRRIWFICCPIPLLHACASQVFF